MDTENDIDPILLSDEEDAEPAESCTTRYTDLLATLFPAAAAPPTVSSTGQSRSVSERASQLMNEFVSTIEGFPRLQELGQAVEASLQSLGSRPLRAPPTKCAVCSENLVINDKIQELPCKHLFHPLCLMPTNTTHAPVCRHELPTDNQEYESWKESEAEKVRKDASNSVC
ncbi:hypothetical protein MKX03_028970 [Papaver bracteatum]|nr:hypothetical protein MKX03_028970 [Papaver bracteatum]